MLLRFTEGLQITNHYDAECAAVADRHYSRRTRGARQFLYAGRKLVLRNWNATIVFAWVYPDPTYRDDGQVGVCCALFRNESDRPGSEIILEAETFAQRKWGPTRFFTYVDPRKVASANPGYCFKVAGWKFIRRSKRGKHLLAKDSPSP